MNLGSHTFTVEVDETDWCVSWQLSLEQVMVVIEESDCVLKTLNWIHEPLVDQNCWIELLVSPVNF